MRVRHGRRLPYSTIPHWVIDSGVSARAIALFAVLDRYASQEDDGLRRCYPKRATLGAQLGCSVATVKRSLAELEAIGALERRQAFHYATGAHGPNIYTLHHLPPERDGMTPMDTSFRGSPMTHGASGRV